MKLAKKTLSVFLSLLMIFSTCSVCLTGLSLTASAASSYTVSQVKSLVSAVAAKAATQSSSSNAWNYPADDGSVLAAADAVYDYAVNGVRTSGTTSTLNSSDAIYNKVLSDLGYTAASNEGKFIKNVLYADGTTTYGYSSKQSNTGNWKDETSYSNGRDLTNDSHVSYNSAVTASVTKTAVVNVNRDAYLLTFDKISDIPVSFPLKVTYTFAHTQGKSASQTSQKTEDGGCFSSDKYIHYWTSYAWNYLSNVSRTVDTTDTTTQPALVAAAAYFTADRLATKAEEMLNLTVEELEAIYADTMNRYNAIAGVLSSTVLDHFFDKAAIDAYVYEVDFAAKVVRAQPNMADMLEYIEAGYNSNDIEQMNSVYTKASKAFNNIKDYNDDIFEFVLANYEGFDSFTKDGAQAFVDKLYLDIEIYRVKEIKAAIDGEIEDYSDKIADPYNRDDITDLELTELKSRLDGYGTSYMQYSSTAINAVFTETTDYYYEFKGNVQLKINAREIDVNYLPHNAYFIPMIFENLADLEADDLAWYEEDVLTGKYEKEYAKYQELLATYNEHLNTYDKTVVDNVYTITYGDEKVLLQVAVEDYLDRILAQVKVKVESSLSAVKYYAEAAPEVNFSNVVELGTALSDYSVDLYDYAVGKSLVSNDYKAIAATVNSIKAEYDKFIASGGLDDFVKVAYDKNGYYTIRYAGDQTDSNGIQIGYPNDIARDGADDNYVVTNKELETTVNKIDTLITSEELGGLLGLKDADGNQYETLGAYVDGLIGGLFSDDTINMIIGALFPMVTKLLETELVGMLEGLGGGAKPTNGATAAIDLAALEIDFDVSGKLNVYLNTAKWNGEQKQKDFSQVFSEIGLNIYPGPLADSLANSGAISTTSELYKAMKSANNTWLPLATDPTAEEPVYEFNHEWGVTDYESFAKTFGYILDAIKPLINTLFGTDTFSTGEVSRVGYAATQGQANLKVGSGWLSLSISPEIRANAGLELTINPVNLYDKLWIPLMEAVGVTDFRVAPYTLKQFPTNASGYTAAKYLFDPVLALVEQVKAAPIEKVLEILPGLVYALSMDKLQFILEDLQIKLGVNLVLRDIWLSVDNVPSWAESIIEGALDGLSIDDLVKDPFILGELLDLQELLGFDYHNINEILEFALGSTGLTFPEIKQSDLIFLADVNKNVASYRTSGSRIKFTADKADILYYLLGYVSDMLGSTEFVDGVLALIQGDSEEAIELPPIVYDIISNAGMNPDGLLAAVVELFVPQKYDTPEMKWFNSDYNYGSIQGVNDASIVYLTYGNDWTKQKADYLLDNIDAILESVLEMTGSDETQINEILKDAISGIITNNTITTIINGIVSLGGSSDATTVALLEDILETDITMISDAFSYLFVTDEDRAAEDFVEPLKPGDEGYINTTLITASTNEVDGKTVITWSYNGEEFVDGDREMFLDLLIASIENFIPLLASFFKGEDINILGAIELLCYDSYDDTFGLLLEVLGVENIMDQSEYEAYAAANGDAAAVRYMVNNALVWVDGLLEGNTVKKIVDILPNIIYFIESNGLSTFLLNLLQPVLVILDTVRPLLNVDLNGVLSYVVSELINYGELNIDNLLQFISGVYVNDDLEYKWFALDVKNLNITEIVKLVDVYFGTKLADSQLINPGLKGLCAGRTTYDSILPGSYKSTMDAADAITILLSSVLEAAEYEVADGKTNGDIICEFVDAELVKKGEEPKAAEIYSVVVDLIKGLEISYTVPNWGYMLTADAQLEEKVVLPTPSIVYLGYNTDWTPEVADSVYGVLDEVLDLVLPTVLDEGETLDTLINGLLEDNVYSDKVLNKLVELIVNAIATLDVTLRDLIDVAIDTDIAAWFAMCEETVGEDGKPKFVCTKNWGIDAAAEADKKDLFVAALKEVLTPAERLLAWLFFGKDIALFTGSEVDADGEYVYNDIITVNGGEGYAYGLVPIFEALGCEMKPASAYATTADAVEDLINALLARVDEITANPVEEVFKLLPNIVYFVNADGLVSCVNNLLQPVDGLVEMLSPIISEDGSKVSIGGLLEPTVGFDISNITTETLLNIGVDKGFVFSEEIVEIISTLYVGNLVEFESANGNKAYRLDVSEAENDVLTIVLCLALDLFKLNKETFAPLMGEDVYDTVVTLIAGAVADFSYIDPDWAYMYEGEDALAQLLANNLPARTEENSIVYTQYTNNWNEATADYLDSILFDLIKGITESARDDGKTVGILLDDAITNGLYQDDILDSFIEAVVGLMLDYEEIIKGAGALLGAESIADWFDYCTVTTDANGETVVTCTKDWGIDSAPTNAAKRTAFVEAFVTALEPAYRLLGWLLFGEEYEFLDGTTSEVLITIKGGNGYAEAFVPLLEALGCTMGADTDSGIKAPEEFYVNGALDMEQVVRDVFTALTDVLAEICGDMNKGAIDVMLEKLPNVIYFINAGGLKSVVNNLLQPVNFILEALEPMGVNVDFSTLVKQIDITNIDFYAIFALVEDLVGLRFPADVQKFVAEFYMGEVVKFTSANGKQAFRMQYTEAESRADMITILISLVLDAAQDPGNEGKLSDWLGEDVYWAIMNVLRIEKCKDMEEYNWILTEYANTGKQFSAIETSTRYSVYNEYWTKDKAQYMADNFNPLVSNVLCLLGLEINGTVTHDIYDLLDVVISDNLYTQEMADTILNAIKDLLANLTELEPYGEYIVDVLNTAFGVDLSVYDTMTVTITEGTREEFETALVQMLTPVVPLLEVILCGENLSLFYELDGDETIVIFGSEGYAYGIIPLFEALGCTMPTPEEYKAAVENNPEAAIRYLTTPLLDRVDAVMADPLNGILEILPAAMYFINSNGLETAFTNLVAAVDTVLVGLEPVVGARSLEELLDIDLSEFDAEYILDMLVDMLNESTGMDFSSLAVNLVAELTFGEVVDYVSANSETYYTMNTDGVDNADMTTAVLRMTLDFITTEENLEQIKVLLADAVTDEDAYNSICSILDTLAEYAAEDPGMSKAMSFIYAVFEAATEALEKTDDAYHDVNNSWQFILKLLSTSEEPLLRDFADNLKGTLNKYFDGIFDEEGLAPDGVMTFWDRLVAFFQRIGEFFRKLFGME